MLVLDFDGTICLGDGPVWAYADAITPYLDQRLARQVSDGLLAYLEGHATAATYADGYSAIAALAGPHVPASALKAAYGSSRDALADGRLDIHAPDGLADLLDRIAPAVRIVVVTNAPSTGLDTALAKIGLTAHVDQVIPSAGKPAGSQQTFTGLLAGAAPAHLMSVGDIWVNDIEPALAIGAATAFVDRSGRDDRPAHAKATDITELYAAIEKWSSDPVSFLEANPIRS